MLTAFHWTVQRVRQSTNPDTISLAAGAVADLAMTVMLAGRTQSWQDTLIVVQPDTLLRWHRDLPRLVGWHKTRSLATFGRSAMSPSTIRLIQRMVTVNNVGARSASAASCSNWVFPWRRARTRSKWPASARGSRSARRGVRGLLQPWTTASGDRATPTVFPGSSNRFIARRPRWRHPRDGWPNS